MIDFAPFTGLKQKDITAICPRCSYNYNLKIIFNPDELKDYKEMSEYYEKLARRYYNELVELKRNLGLIKPQT